ncbi:MAG: hypothetical protein ACI4JE_01705 [Ruminococcus sp.]
MNFTKGQKIAMMTVGIAILFLYLKFIAEYSLTVCIVASVIAEVILALSFYFEFKSDKKSEQINNDIQNGDYHSSDEWNEKYADFVNNKGFEPIKHCSMKADLYARYRRPVGFFMIIFGAAVTASGFVFIPEVGAIIFLTLVGLGLAAYGIYCLSAMNVRRFIRRCGDALPEIERSYMEGKLLTYKKSASDEYCNDGINIGSDYVIIFTPKDISALKRADISNFRHKIKRTKYYGNGVYTGTVYTHHIEIDVINPRNGAVKTFSAQLGEFRSELACEEMQKIKMNPHIGNDVKEYN